MKKRGATALSVMVILLAVIVYIALFGIPLGNLREIRPLGTQIKEQKLGLDLTGGFSAVYQADSSGVDDFDTKMEGAISVLRTRLDAKGMTEATVTRQGDNKIRVEIPTTDTDPASISQYLGTPAKLQWKDSDGNVIVEGANIVSATPGMYQGQYIVSFKLDAEGTKAFAEATAKMVGQYIGIYIDDEQISNPKVNQAITGGEGQISGSFTAETATELAMQIESGALPLEMEEAEVRSISATLGEDALEKSVFAGAIGIGLIMLFMFAMYRVMGLMADIALAYYIVIVLFCILTLPGVQLTLPGIAGLILSIGMAVDANVIIFERIKEELWAGKTAELAIESGFKKAFSAILDSNVTTLIAAFVLMLFGTGTIKGFAYTLAVGIAVSMLTAFTITRFLMRQLPKINVVKQSLYTRPSRAQKQEG